MGAAAPLDVVVLAAGQGKRMKSRRAKVMHAIGGRSLLRHVLAATAALKPARTFVVVGPKADDVRAELAGDNVRIVEQKKRLGTGHAVLQTAAWHRRGRRDVLVVCGDVPLLTPETLKKLHRRHRRAGAAATMLTFRPADPGAYGRVLRDGRGSVIGIRELKDATAGERAVGEVNSGIYVFDRRELFDALPALSNRNEAGEYYLTDVIGRLVDAGKRVVAIDAGDPDEVEGVNTLAELARAGRILRWRTLAGHLARGVRVVDPDTTYIDVDVTIGEGTTIYPFTVILDQCRIGRDCAVGPFSHLRNGTVLEDGAEVGNFTEVKKSVLGEKSKAKHLAYIGDATLGRRVNVGAGTITANWDGRSKHATILDDDVYVGSNTVFVAPVRVGKRVRVGAGAVVIRDVPDDVTIVGAPARVLPPKGDPKRSSKKKRGGGR